MPDKRKLFLLGLLVGLATLGLIFLFSRLDLTTFIPTTIANTIVKITPGDIASAVISTLGKWGMRLIIGSSVIGFVVAYGVAALALVRFARGRGLGAWLVLGTLIGIIGVALSVAMQQLIPANKVNLPENTSNLATLVVLLGSSGLALGGLLYGYTQRPVATAGAGDVDTSRRQFLTRSAGAALSVAMGSGAFAMFIPERRIEQAGAALPTQVPQTPTLSPTDVPSTATPTTAVAEGVTATTGPTATPAPPTATPLPAFVPAPGTRPEITEQESLYLISIATEPPRIDPNNWTLSIYGMVDNPYDLSYDELLALPRHDQTSTLQCISNEVGNLLIGNCNWNGVRLRDLLERAGVQEGVVDVVLYAAEGYTESLPLEQALDPDTIVAYGIDGQSLTEAHGFPARIRVPYFYGVKNVKWLTGIELVSNDYQGYWQQRGWTDDPIVKTTSVYDTGNPRLGDNVLEIVDNRVELGGIAFAGDRGISHVEVQIDGGEWQAARLKESSNDLSWRLWRYDWRNATPGSYTLAVRAVDSEGQPQTSDVFDTLPSGASGYHTIEVEVR